MWARIGCLSFGGAAGQIAMMHRYIVEEKKWVEERRFLDALNFCTLLPGPEAQQLATYLGWRLHGVKGGVVAGAFFVIPGAVFMLGLSILYVLGRGVPWIEGLFFGIKSAVVIIVIEALLRIGRRALKTPLLVALAIASFLSLLVLKLPFPLVIFSAAAIGMVLAGTRPDLVNVKPATGNDPGDDLPLSWAAALKSSAIWLGIWWLPVALALVTLGPGHILVELGLFFSKLAVVTFGGAYAVLAWLAEAAVQTKGWVSAAEMVDGLGLAETTPGPTILVNQFVGFLAAHRSPAPFTPLVAASLGALMTVWVTFAPSWLWIFAGAPLFERWRRNPMAQGALGAITAAVCGVIASLVVVFGLNVLFGQVGRVDAGPVHLPWPVWGTIRWDALALTGLAGLMLLKWHRSIIETVALLAALGMGLSFLR